jgi:3-(methylthio)propionyl---CoA ligase
MAARKKRAAGNKSTKAKRRAGRVPKKRVPRKPARKTKRPAKTKPAVQTVGLPKARALLPRAKSAPGARRRPNRRLAQPVSRPVSARVPRVRAINAYETGLDRNPANYQPLTPLTFLRHAAEAHPETIAIVHGKSCFTYAEFYARSVRLASALMLEGIERGDTVSVLLSNTPPMLEAHHGVPMAGAVLNALNTRLDAASIAFMLDHSEARVFIVDREFAQLAQGALKLAKAKPMLIAYNDPEFPMDGALEGAADYEAFIAQGAPEFDWTMPEDEWNAISLSYTSGTTGNPKGVVSHHRGAALMGYSNLIACQMTARPVYLWTLPMFHCNGWAFPWTLALVAGTHVCLRWVRARDAYAAIAEHKVTHLCGAPTVMLALLNAKPDEKKPLPHRVNFVHAAAPPPEAVLAGMLDAGFDLTHVYGLTETYGPATMNDWHPEWDSLGKPERIGKRIRQGVPFPALERLTVRDPKTMERTPADGETLGEVMFRGNIVMKGYLKNPEASRAAFAGGWFHSGDLGVMHKDGYIQLKDRSKDIIISGGENISSIEVENALYKHPAVMFAAVVARPDEKWGETPCAFVERKPGFETVGEAELASFCRAHLARFKCPKTFVFCELPKTTTGKIQKFRLREQAASLR